MYSRGAALETVQVRDIEIGDQIKIDGDFVEVEAVIPNLFGGLASPDEIVYFIKFTGGSISWGATREIVRKIRKE